MKKSILLGVALCLSQLTYSQGGWILDKNPLNDVSRYTTIYSYVGCSFIDINGDQFIDLYAAPKTLFINNGDGTYSNASPLNFTVGNSTSGSSCADLDNDGDNDIIVACLPSKVFFNKGNGTFSDSTSQVPGLTFYGSWAVAIGNYNEDSNLDFVFAHANGYHPPSTPSPCKFFYQQSSIFDPLPVSGYPFLINLDAYTNPYWSDYDLDGDMDLFIASGPVGGIPDFDYCYKNLKIETGNDTLVKMTSELFAAEKQDGQCYNFIDYDNDGDLDLCLTNYYSAPTRMYKNNAGTYTNIATPFTTATTNIANCWGDYDNDGDLDVIITNDNQITKYYRNNLGLSFTYLSGGFSTSTATNGISNCDYDNDGDLDVFTNGIGNNGNSSSIGLFINDTVASNRSFVNLKLSGTISNQSAIGAIVRLKATISGRAVWQMREVNAQNSFQGQNDLRIHFGLGDALIIDSIFVTWPSGGIESFHNIMANSFYGIEEGLGITSINVSTKAALTSSGFTLYPDPASDYLELNIETQNNKLFFQYEIINSNGQLVLIDQINSSSNLINITDLPAGCHYFRLSGKVKSVTKKFIKL